MAFHADVGIVGAGFAGLAAALMLRRHRHSVVVFDGGPCRNTWANEVHGYLGARGLSGKEMREQAIEQVREVGGRIEKAAIQRAVKDGDGRFALSAEDGRSWHFPRVLLATGVTDVYPDIDNFWDYFGRSVHVCPHCDAYEWRDQPVAIVSWGKATLPFALKLTQWTPHITVVTDGHSPDIDAEARQTLAEHNIRIITATVKSFEGDDGLLRCLRFVDGSTLDARAAFFNIAETYSNDLAKQLGCRLKDGQSIETDEHQRTSVEGVWAAGDVAGEEQLVAVATSQGVKAAVDIYRTFPLPSGHPKL